MLVKEAHDIGESLQKKIEQLADVERVSHPHLPLSLSPTDFLLGFRSYRL